MLNPGRPNIFRSYNDQAEITATCKKNEAQRIRWSARVEPNGPEGLGTKDPFGIRRDCRQNHPAAVIAVNSSGKFRELGDFVEPFRLLSTSKPRLMG